MFGPRLPFVATASSCPALIAIFLREGKGREIMLINILHMYSGADDVSDSYFFLHSWVYVLQCLKKVIFTAI